MARQTLRARARLAELDELEDCHALSDAELEELDRLDLPTTGFGMDIWPPPVRDPAPTWIERMLAPAALTILLACFGAAILLAAEAIIREAHQ